MNNQPNQPTDHQKLTEQLLKAANGKVSPAAIAAAARGDSGALLNALPAEDRRQVSQILSDPKAMQRLMGDEKLRKLIAQLGGKNG